MAKRYQITEKQLERVLSVLVEESLKDIESAPNDTDEINDTDGFVKPQAPEAKKHIKTGGVTNVKALPKSGNENVKNYKTPQAPEAKKHIKNM
jgi:hypothetical protein